MVSINNKIRMQRNILRRFFISLITVTLFWGISICAEAASQTALLTDVPETVDIQVVLHGKGSICVDGQAISQSSTITVTRLSNLKITFLPESSGVLLAAKLNSNSLLPQLSGNQVSITAPGLQSVLEVQFSNYYVPYPGNPKTGDYLVEHVFWVFICSAFMICYIMCTKIIQRRKTK